VGGTTANLLDRDGSRSTMIDRRFGPTPAVFRAHCYPSERFVRRDPSPGRFDELGRRIAGPGLRTGEE
jgi:hypothetical protein